MTKKPRIASPTETLARAFVTEFLKAEWDYRLHRRQLADAKNMLKPAQGEPYDPEIVLGALRFMASGKYSDWDKPIQSLWA